MGTLVWVVGGAIAMVLMGLAIDTEMRDFPGGPEALVATVLPAAEAMRPLRWPAERLDTLGGYLTYHNIMLFSGFLAIYAAVQGARAVRGPEDRHSLEQVLAAGWSRGAFLRDRALGFVIVLALIAVGLASGVAVALQVAGQPDVVGSLITLTAIGLCSLTAYALAVFVSQLVQTSRAAAGVSVLILVVMYVLNNVWEEIGPWGVVRFVTPFYYANQSRALVPGYGLDLSAMLTLAAMALVLLLLAAVVFTHRDYGAGIRARSSTPHLADRVVVTQRWWLRTTWLAHLHQHQLGLAAWAVATAAFMALMMGLQPTVMEAWEMFASMVPAIGGAGIQTPEAMYTSLAADIIAPVVVAYAITQSAGWVTDLAQGRVEALLSAPLSWTRLVGERLLATVIGVLVISATALIAVVCGSAYVGAEIDLASLGRVLIMCLLLGWAMAAVAAVAVSVLRSMVAVTVLAVYGTAAYLLSWLVPIFGWPDQILRLSVFDAFGHPYQAWPAWSGLIVLAVMCIGGSIAAAALSERTPKVAE